MKSTTTTKTRERKKNQVKIFRKLKNKLIQPRRIKYDQAGTMWSDWGEGENWNGDSFSLYYSNRLIQKPSIHPSIYCFLLNPKPESFVLVILFLFVSLLVSLLYFVETKLLIHLITPSHHPIPTQPTHPIAFTTTIAAALFAPVKPSKTLHSFCDNTIRKPILILQSVSLSLF